MSVPNRTLLVAKLLWRYTDSQHGITIKEMQGDTSPDATGACENAYLEGNLSECGCPATRQAIGQSIDQLRCAGLSIEKARCGNRHEYRLMRHVFTEHELDLIAAAVRSSQAVTERMGDSIIAHLKQTASAQQAARIDERTLVAGHVRRQSESAFEKLDPIYDAIARRRRLFFKYYEYDAHKRRIPRNPCNHDVTPVHVAYSEGRYYLIAYSDAAGREGIRTYRIDHMGSIRALASSAAENDQVKTLRDDPEGALSTLFGMFSGQRAAVTLHVKTRLMRAVIDRFGMDVQAYPDKSDPDNFARVYVNVNLAPTFYSWVLQYDGGIQIVGNSAARQGMKDFLARNSAVYETD